MSNGVDWDTVVTGAGISMASGLPSGDQLAALEWRALCEGLAGVVPTSVTDKAADMMTDWDFGLRLEQLLEILSVECGVGRVIRVYDAVQSSAFNANHVALAHLGVRHVTLNMDLLAEAAGGEALHLHGRVDRPETIKTTVSQYSEGLDQDVATELTSAIEAKRVLFVGYSGRDIDVMPIINRHPPSHITWVVRPNRDGTVPGLGYEVESLCARYASGEIDGVFDVYVGTAEDLFSSVLPPSLLAGAPARASHDSPGVPPALRAALAELSQHARIIAISMVLYDLGLSHELISVLSPLRFRGRLEVRRRKILARVLRRQGRNGKAVGLLVRPMFDRPGFIEWTRNGNELAETLRFTRIRRIGTLVDIGLVGTSRLAPGSQRTQAVGAGARTRLAQSALSRNRLDLAVRRFEAVRDTTNIGVPTQINTATWFADALKLQGRLDEGLRAVQSAVDLNFYAGASQRAWAYWKRAEILGLGASDLSRDLSVTADLATARRHADQAGDGDAIAWTIAMSLANESDGVDPDELLLRWKAARVGAGLEALTWSASQTETYVSLHLSEVSRARRDYSRARQFAHAAMEQSRERRRHPSGGETAQLAAQLALASADIAGGEAGERTLRTLIALRRGHLRRGMMGGAVRVAIALAALQNTTVDPGVITAARERGCRVEAERSADPSSAIREPWPVLM